MRTLLPLLAATTLGLTLPHAEAHKTVGAKELLFAQREIQTSDDKYSKPVDKATVKDGSNNNTWIPIGWNENKIAALWIRSSTYKPLNENSFRLQAQYTNDNGRRIEGRLDINCKNKDFYMRPNGVYNQNAPWAVIPQGSGLENAAKLYCKRTSAKEEWGYKSSTAYLWDNPVPSTLPEFAEGEWVNHYDKPDGESYYNDDVIVKDGTVTFAMYYRTTKGDASDKNKDTSKYSWVKGSCSKNLGSVYVQLDQSVAGVWLPPNPGRPGGALMSVRKRFCQ